MTARHVVRRAADAQYYVSADGIAPGATGFGRWRAVGFDGRIIAHRLRHHRLEPGGVIPAHLHSFEESFHSSRAR